MTSPDGSLDAQRAGEWLLWSLLTVAAIAQVWVALRYQGIAEDGAYCLRVLLTGDRPSCLEPARWAVQLLFEAPVLVAARWFAVSTATATVIYSLTLQLAPLLITAAAAGTPPREARAFRFAPVFCYFASASAIVSFGLIEGPTAAAWFWLVLYRLMFAPQRSVWMTLILVAAAPFVHEVVAFLGMLLAVAAWLRADRADTGSFRVVMRLAALFLAAAAVIQAVHIALPHNRANRDGLLSALIAFRWLYDPVHGIGLAALLGLLATAVLLVAWRWPALRTPAYRLFAGLAILCGIGVWVGPLARAPLPLFVARDQPAFVSFCIGTVVLAAWARPGTGFSRLLTAAAHGRVVLAALSFATLMTLVALNRDWTVYIAAFRATLDSSEGLVSWRHVVASAPPETRAVLERMTWGWTNPDLSLLLSRDRRIRAIIANPEPPAGEPTPWRPWDPAVPATWPRTSRFDMGSFQPDPR